jgi:hypothetical protein
LISTDGNRVTLRSSEAAPPGATLTASAVDYAAQYVIKVKACRRAETEGFLIEGRFVDLSRQSREQLLAKVAIRGP